MRASFSSDAKPCSFLTQLGIEGGNLRLQFLDAGMAAEQRRRLFGKLGAKRDALLRLPSDQL